MQRALPESVFRGIAPEAHVISILAHHAHATLLPRGAQLIARVREGAPVARCTRTRQAHVVITQSHLVREARLAHVADLAAAEAQWVLALALEEEIADGDAGSCKVRVVASKRWYPGNQFCWWMHVTGCLTAYIAHVDASQHFDVKPLLA